MPSFISEEEIQGIEPFQKEALDDDGVPPPTKSAICDSCTNFHSPVNSGNLKVGTSKKSKTKKKDSFYKVLNPYLTRILIYLNYEA